MLNFILPLFGILVVGQILHKIYVAIYEIYFMKGLNLVERYGKGSTVVITGGSDGIGLAYAHEFASQGFNLVLISKTQEKLAKRAHQISALYPSIQIQTIATDLATGTTEYYNQVFEQINSDNVSVLINCAGVHVGTLLQEPLERLRDALMVNSVSTMMLTRNFFFKYKPQLPTKKAIINFTTHCHELEVSAKSIYNSSMHSIAMFTHGEGINLRRLGYDVLLVKPVNVSTAMNGYRAPDLLTSTPEETVKASLKALGNVNMTYGTPNHIRYGIISEQIRIF